jgi:hypothetical protein
MDTVLLASQQSEPEMGYRKSLLIVGRWVARSKGAAGGHPAARQSTANFSKGPSTNYIKSKEAGVDSIKSKRAKLVEMCELQFSV